MTKRSKILLFGIIAVVVVIGAVLMLPKAAPEVQATIPVNFDIPIEFESDWETFRFLGDVEVYSDEACTQLMTELNNNALRTDYQTFVEASFKTIPNAEVLYVKVPSYITTESTSLYSVELSDTEEVYLEIDGEPCFKLKDIKINQEIPKSMVSTGGTMMVVFEAVGKQYFHPGTSTMVIDGETYESTLQGKYKIDEATGEDMCVRFSCTFLIPDDIEIDVNDLEMTFDLRYDLHQGFVVPYYPNAVTE